MIQIKTMIQKSTLRPEPNVYIGNLTFQIHAQAGASRHQNMRELPLEQKATLPGQPPETLTAENGCFQRSEVSSGTPFPCADKDLCR